MMTMMKTAKRLPAAKACLVTGGAMLAMLASTPSSGASLLDVSFAGANASGDVRLTLDADPFAGLPGGDPEGAQAITAASGTFSDTALGIDHAAITGLLALNFAPPPPDEILLKSYSFHAFDAKVDPTKGFSYDNLYYAAGSPIVCVDDKGNPKYPFSGGFLDVFGAVLTLDSGALVGLWSNGVMPGIGLNYGYNVIAPTQVGFELLDSQFNGVTAVAVPVPEPDTESLLSLGLLCGFAWRRSAKTKPRLG